MTFFKLSNKNKTASATTTPAITPANTPLEAAAALKNSASSSGSPAHLEQLLKRSVMGPMQAMAISRV
ncbi:hypothetical protein BGZ94_003667 [Podila epigama]|nr:hypothetical protein BGZ94_003667 [Podila epigama]